MEFKLRSIFRREDLNEKPEAKLGRYLETLLGENESVETIHEGDRIVLRKDEQIAAFVIDYYTEGSLRVTFQSILRGRVEEGMTGVEWDVTHKDLNWGRRAEPQVNRPDIFVADLEHCFGTMLNPQ